MKKPIDIEQPNQVHSLSSTHSASDRMAMVLMNLFAFPGSGSWLMGYRHQAGFQMVLSTVGVILSGYGVIDFWLNYQSVMIRILEASQQGTQLTQAFGVMLYELRLPLIGLLLFMLALLWSILTVLLSQKNQIHSTFLH